MVVVVVVVVVVSVYNTDTEYSIQYIIYIVYCWLISTSGPVLLLCFGCPVLYGGLLVGQLDSDEG